MNRRNFLRLLTAGSSLLAFPRFAEVQQAVDKKTYTYKTADQLDIQADVYGDAAEKARPVVIWIHGGALMVGHRGGVGASFLDPLVKAGYAVVSIDYRLAPETKLPAILEDVQDACQWVRQKGPELFQADPQRIAVAAVGVQVKADWKLDGVDLLPYLTGKNRGAPHETLYWRFGEQMAIRRGDWKLVKAPGAGAEFAERRGRATVEGAHLYNLVADIGEQNNLAAKEPERVKQLAEAWEKWNAELQEPRWVPGRAK